MSRVAVVLFNLGGPDSLDAVEPFLRNLFRDPAIIRAPAPLRHLIARLIARRRGPKARDIYREIGCRSPLLPETEAQAAALAQALGDLGAVSVTVAMRYWHPMSEAAARQVAAFRPERIVLLPLYPQFSTTTTASSLAAWRRAAASAGIAARTHAVCCYHRAEGLIAAHAALIEPVLEAAAEAGAAAEPRVLFSAHGLPKSVVARGDPYQWQVEETARAVVARLDRKGLDWKVCYQSKVGPMAWLGPSTEGELDRAGRARVPVVVAPIAFVSEHSETLVELDITYRARARAAGVPTYHRVPALGTQPAFIAALAQLVRAALERDAGLDSGEGGKLCPAAHRCCPLAGT